MNQRNPDPQPAASRVSEDPARREFFTHWLIRRAARGAPGPLSERLEEEWLADLATRSSPLSRLRFALGCCWATRLIAYEHGVTGAAVASAATVGKLTLADFRKTAFFPRNSTTVIMVVALHLAVLYALTVGFGIKFPRLIAAPFQAHMVSPDLRPPPPPPTLPEPRTKGVTIEVPVPPEIRVASDPDEVVVKHAPANPPQLPPAGPPHVIKFMQGGPGSGFPVTDDFYPSAARRLEEQGAATVRVCVDPNGRLTAPPMNVVSSGYPRLDEGALQLARAGSGHYRPSTEDGRPVNSCYAFRVRFELNN